MDHLKAKVDAGADWICTQLFFNNHAFHDWKERVRLKKIDVPIQAGIMPITSIGGLQRMADLAAGTVFPAPLLKNRSSQTVFGEIIDLSSVSGETVLSTHVRQECPWDTLVVHA